MTIQKSGKPSDGPVVAVTAPIPDESPNANVSEKSNYAKSAAIFRHNRRFIPGGVVSLNRAVQPEIAFTRGQGAYIWDYRILNLPPKSRRTNLKRQRHLIKTTPADISSSPFSRFPDLP